MISALNEHQARFSLRTSSEYSQAALAGTATLALGAVLLLNGYSPAEGGFRPLPLYAGLIYLFFAALQFGVMALIRRDIIRHGEIRRGTRALGFVLLPALLSGNVFVAIAALQLVRRRPNVIYTMAVYGLLATLLVIAVTAMNLFKPYVADTFLLGAYLLIAVAVIQLLAVIVIAGCAGREQPPRFLGPLAALLIATSVTGNLFSLAAGFLLIRKLREKRDHAAYSRLGEVIGRIANSMAPMLGLLFIVFLLMLALTSYLTFEYGFAVDNNYSAILKHPSLAYPFGTDNFGRDVFSRIVFGARISLSVGFLSTLIPFVIGGMLGAVSGDYGRHADNLIMRALDVLYAIPGILLAIAIIAAFGTSLPNLILALSVGAIPTYARTMRANVMVVSTLDYVQAARSLGVSDWKIMYRHIVPNSLAPMIVKSTLTLGTAVISTSSLSYLGLGVEPHIPEWGNILKVGSAYLETHPHTAIYPGLAIVLLVLSFNFLGDGLRDALDPKHESSSL